jgi:hypothetical protein
LRWTLSRSQAVKLGAIAAAFVLTCVVRWLTFTGLGGNDRWSLWTVSTCLKGDLPFRDFVDAATRSTAASRRWRSGSLGIASWAR